MRPFRSLCSTTTCTLLILTAYACSGPQIAQRTLPVANQPPLPRPEVYLYVDQFPKEPEGTEGVVFTLPLVSAGYQMVREDDGVAQDLTYTLDFRAAAGPDGPAPLHRIALITSGKMVPRLSRNSIYTVAYYYHDRGMFLPPSLGLVIRDSVGTLVYLLSSDEAVPAEAFPGEFKVLPTQKKAFNTTRVTSAGCSIFKRHHFVEFATSDRPASLAPGVTTEITVAGGRYRLTLFDYSVSDSEMECLVEDPPHFSFLLEFLGLAENF